MLITEILARNARVYGQEIALIERDPAKNSRREITWEQFEAEANRIANALIAKGIKKGDKVVHLMMNCIEWLPAYFGILRTGAWVVPLNFRFSGDDIKLCSEIAEAKALMFGEEFIDRVDSVKAALDKTVAHYIYVGPENKRPGYAEQFTDFLASENSENPSVEFDLLDNAGLYFTSGTTGRPKAVLLTHRNLEHACYVENRHHNQTHEDNFLCIPPLYHTGAKMHWFGNFIVGARAVILKGIKPEWILEAVSQEKATIVWLLVPWAHDILIALENKDVNLNDYELAQWRLMHIGAQPIPPSLINNWKKVFPHHDYDTNYGLTESTGPGCVHLGLENKNPEATAATLKDGWLFTGDIARMDEDGFIWLVDRAKDIIITGGENIFPVEIESFIMEHAKVQDVGVIGLPDERLGEIVAAIIKSKPNQTLTEKEVADFCEGLPRYKRPRKIIFDEVPRSPTGKIEKPKLRKTYTGISERIGKF